MSPGVKSVLVDSRRTVTMTTKCFYILGFMCVLITPIFARSQLFNDFRQITYSDVSKEANVFQIPGIYHYSQLLFDVKRFQLIVGARNNLFRLDLIKMTNNEQVEWSSKSAVVNMCKQKGQSNDDCHNYIRVLLADGDRVLACGTNAFNPKCTWRNIERLKSVQQSMNGVARSPYSPHHNMTAIMTSSGDYYIASVVDFSARDAAIYRTMGNSPIIRTVQYDSKWLNEPNFVGSFEIGQFVYFFFRETAVERMNCGKVIYSRVARICKNDKGGKFVLKENWTTFLKARLNCSIGADYPFYFNEIQSIYYMPQEEVFYATFTTPDTSIYGGAICSFNLSAIHNAFDGPFSHQDNPKSIWLQQSSPHNHFQCNTPGNSEHLLDSAKYQLMNDAVQSTINRPIHMEELSRFAQIVAQSVPVKHRLSGIHIVFVATNEGLIKKLSVDPKTHKTCLIEQLELIHKDSQEVILTMKILKETNSLYIGTNHSVKRIKVHRCNRFKTRRACINARDPYCGWHSHSLKCTTAPNDNPLVSFWYQDLSSCPVLSDPVNGEWSDWTKWSDCKQKGSSSDKCKCRQRKCRSPPPMNGGRPCSGHSFEVSNCTQNGQWTGWSAWSACSQTCGIAIKTRRRMCGNPAPKFGGRICVGPERQEIFCTTNPPCPNPSPPKVNGQWSTFGPWQECSTKCGGGIQVRRRRCDSPSPKNGGSPCSGCNLEYQPCNSHSCPDVGQMTDWTPWLKQLNLTTKNGYYQQRFRFTCHAPVAQSRLISNGPLKSERRFCYNDKRGCSDTSGDGDISGGWSAWSEWSKCSSNCGGGIQKRHRTCSDPYPAGGGDDCLGANVEERACKGAICQGSWSCWSEYGACSVTCGSGIRKRTRNCTNPQNRMLPGYGCEGESVFVEACEGGPCYSLRGWGDWSVWSECSTNKHQVRRRLCQSNSLGSCRGNDEETRVCVSLAQIGNNGIPLASHHDSSKDKFSIAHVIGAVIGGFFIGVLTGALLLRFFKKRNGDWPKEPRLENNFISAKDNHYVSSFEMHSKTPFTATINGTLRKALPGVQATIKKPITYNGHTRAPYLDEPKNFDY